MSFKKNKEWLLLCSVLVVVGLFCSCLSNTLRSSFDTDKCFKLVYKVDKPMEKIELSLPKSGDDVSGYKGYEYKYDFIVSWGDGTYDKVTSSKDKDKSHRYLIPGEYTVKIKGTMESFSLLDLNDTDGTSILLMVEDDEFNGSYSNVVSVENWGDTNLKYVCFALAENLNKIASPQKDSFKDIKSFENAFYGTGITTIPKDLFKNAPNISNFRCTFYDTGIKNIPDKLFSNNIKSKNFDYTFANCSKITNIPNKLFKNNKDVKSFVGTFMHLESITTIPSELFSNNTKVESFKGTFLGCNGLKSIKGDLFNNNKKVESFESIFGNCENLEEIGQGLFSNNTKVKSFESSFVNCWQLKEIPKNLFYTNEDVVTFKQVFNNCMELKEISPDLFSKNNKVEDFSYAFAGCNSVKGDIPKLWETHKNVKATEYCFEGVGVIDWEQIPDSYNSIPSNWRD